MQASTVTQEFWELVMGNNPSSDKSWKDNPVTDVSWYDCQEFIKKLNSLTGKKYRLPTEAEWEYAARGGKFSKGYKYAGSDDVNEVAWHTGLTVFKASESEDEEGEWIIEIEPNSNDKIHPVKEKKPNELGLYDMSGNVCEWCNDWFGDYRLNEAYSKNPQGPDRGTYKVLRGGGRSFGFEAFLVAFRCYAHPNNDLIGGFRLLSPVE
jgi:formylglycine-generating enzyme required for sulfatase activity